MFINYLHLLEDRQHATPCLGIIAKRIVVICDKALEKIGS
jgi:hypothetical protein